MVNYFKRLIYKLTAPRLKCDEQEFLIVGIVRSISQLPLKGKYPSNEIYLVCDGTDEHIYHFDGKRWVNKGDFRFGPILRKH